MENARKMPPRIDLGRQFASTMSSPMMQWRNWKEHPEQENAHWLRTVMGYCLPAWQRPLVWTDAQKISFIESAWLGIHLGTYTYNRAEIGSPLDNLLIDGQQRMNAIECYLLDQFPVFGWRWSDVGSVDRRRWEMATLFPSFVTCSTDEPYLKGYYNLTNFGGTPHKETERAAFEMGEATGAPILDYQADANEPPLTSPADISGTGWKCKARGGVGANDSQECDWPECGCDPIVPQVLERSPK